MNHMMLLNFMSILSVSLGCTNGTSRLDIVQGTPVGDNDTLAKSTVHLNITSSQGTSTCSGTMIGQSYFLTAAHCFDGGVTPSGVRVSFGANYRQPTASYEVTDIKVIASYRNQKNPDTDWNDIAVGFINGRVPEGRWVPRGNQVYQANTEIIAAGYGCTILDWDRLDPSDFGKLRSVTIALSGYRFNNHNIVMNRQSGTHSPGVCWGDSGGPIYVRNGQGFVVIGVISRGNKSNQEMATNIAAYKEWIDSVVGEESPASPPSEGEGSGGGGSGGGGSGGGGSGGGGSGGIPFTKTATVNAQSTDQHEVQAPAGMFEIKVDGDDGTDLDLYVYLDSESLEATRDPSLNTDCGGEVEISSPRTLIIRVVNRGQKANTYKLSVNKN